MVKLLDFLRDKAIALVISGAIPIFIMQIITPVWVDLVMDFIFVGLLFGINKLRKEPKSNA